MFNALGYDPEFVFRNMPEPSGFLRTTFPLRRVLPNVIIAGAQKSGTTSLYGLLIQHPSVASPQLKEPFFFGNDDRFPGYLGKYRKNFPPVIKMAYLRRSTGAAATIDATTNYLDHPAAAQRISQYVPGAKVIIMLRNPIERAWSHYKMAVRNKLESLTFEKALELENERIASGSAHTHNYCRQRLGYRVRGQYADYLGPWLQTFGNNVRVIKAEDFFAAEKKLFDEVLAFLDLPAHLPRDFSPLNQSSSQEQMSQETRGQLTRHFEPFNEALEKMLHVKLNWS